MKGQRRRCPKTGKRSYPDEKVARRALRQAQALARRLGSEKAPHRVYECPHCRQFHLSSQPAHAMVEPVAVGLDLSVVLVPDDAAEVVRLRRLVELLERIVDECADPDRYRYHPAWGEFRILSGRTITTNHQPTERQSHDHHRNSGGDVRPARSENGRAEPAEREKEAAGDRRAR